MDTRNRVVAAVVLVIALTQVAACGTVRKGTAQHAAPRELPQWRGVEDCATNHAPLASSLAPDNGTVPALFVNASAAGWNCAPIPGGRYDAEVVVHWPNGFDQNVLKVKSFELAPGRRLVAKAYERGRGELPASFYRVTAQVDSSPAAGESVTQGSAPGSQIAQAPANESATPDSTDVAPAAASPDQAPSPGAGAAHAGPQPVSIATRVGVAIVAAPFLLPLVAYKAAETLLQVAIGVPIVVIAKAAGVDLDSLDKKPKSELNGPQRTSPGSQPSADCCFVWVEDGQTGELIAGSRPPR